ncbi:uncharacterized protein LOC124281101 [Haliotis rubra]|uniref:uncharacterized protein LOC124281101 n=1 Tax=Haliotis rubra TaxID=36100 RepID=UPI001EE56D41|nr:uncharacterized protein LOC124281101 [Haliotis rubra]XP_046573072.1 uncharacterized protein LOC124281101 [Haliotis rubra]
MLRCAYCGDDIPPEKTPVTDKKYHEECITSNIRRGEEALAIFKRISTQSNVLCMAIHVNYLHGLAGTQSEPKKDKREKRALKAYELQKKATALRNTNSGHILIHLVGRDREDHFTGAFNEFADEKLHTLIQDKSLFTDVYTKRLLSDYCTGLKDLKEERDEVLKHLKESIREKENEHFRLKEQLEEQQQKLDDKDDMQDILLENRLKEVEILKELKKLKKALKANENQELYTDIDDTLLRKVHSYTDFIVLYVEGGVSLTTSDPKTKISLDDRIIDPSDQTLITFLKQRRHLTDLYRERRFEDLQVLNENRSIQFKGYYKGEETDANIVGFMFDDYKLLQYISAFTKIPDGGSYFFGIAEKDVPFIDYKSKKVEMQYVPIKDHEKVALMIKERITESVLACDYDGNINQVIHVDVFFIPSSQEHASESKELAIQVQVRPVNGIVFYDKEGPLAYKVEKDAVSKYTLIEWFYAVTGNSVMKETRVETQV